jgi:putative colanic acid biosynthesis UDP-glucose lipid carrier transferase
MLILLSNVGLVIAEILNPPIIQKRAVSSGDIVKRVFQLSLLQGFFALFFMKLLYFGFVGGRFQAVFCILELVTILIARYFERKVIKKYRSVGGNSRRATFIGADTELLNIYHKLNDDLTMGYRINGYYADEDIPQEDVGKLTKLGTLQYFLDNMDDPDKLEVGDELYVCLSRREKDTIRHLSRFCDHHVVRFYYVPVSVETLDIDLKRELLDDLEVFTTYENPLENPWNKLLKRTFDIVMSIVFLIPTALIFPFVWLIMKIQSPGPLLFKQARTGIDGKTFNCYKFRSMHVNADADKLQATKDDPRKYPFGNFMRKANIDELPQFINVLKGDMSIVGPRPHMLAHTEQYSELIEKYMVRHFVKPGVTGWAQVTGFRGETKELWQMEGRVKRDIWYIEHWSIWLDIRIIWMTLKTMFIHDKNAY